MALYDTPANQVNILRVLDSDGQPSGARVIARRLHQYGTYLTESTVRYHLKMLDERGLTRLVNRRDGREITERGSAELDGGAGRPRPAARDNRTQPIIVKRRIL